MRRPSKSVRIGILLLVVAGCAGLLAHQVHASRVERVRMGLLNCSRGFVELSECMFQWDLLVKSDLDEGPDNHFPEGFLDGWKEPDLDPFSKDGSGYRFFTARVGSLSHTSLIASVGPDGDSDLARLPDQKTVYPPMHVTYLASTVAVSTEEGIEIYNGRSFSTTRPLEGIVYIEYDDGSRDENRGYVVRCLPPHDYFMEESVVLAHLTINSIFQYDPTNGVVSDGDVFTIFPDAEKIKSGEYNAVYGRLE